MSQVFPDEEDEAIEHEIVHFFAKEYGGAVWCSDVRLGGDRTGVPLVGDQSGRSFAHLRALVGEAVERERV